MSGALRSLMALPALLLGACDFMEGGACTTSVEPAIRLEIRDSLTGAGRAASAVAVVASWNFVDTLEYWDTPDSAMQSGPSERGGIYDLTIQTPGYQTWTRSDIHVERDACHVRTVDVYAHLQQ